MINIKFELDGCTSKISHSLSQCIWDNIIMNKTGISVGAGISIEASIQNNIGPNILENIYNSMRQNSTI